MRKLFIVFSMLAVLGFWACGGGEEDKAPETGDQDTYQQDDGMTDDTKLEQADTSAADGDMADKGETAKGTEKTQAVKTDYTSNPIKGKIIALEQYIAGQDGEVARGVAKKIADDGGILALKSGGNIYIVYHESGTIANKKIANYAGRDQVGLWGKVKTKGGQHAFIMSKIASLE